MTVRCGCKDEGDETVFGVCRCAKPAPPVDLFGALVGAIDRAREARQQDFTLSPPVQPWEITLGEDEAHG